MDFVPPEEIDSHWPSILPGIEIVRKRTQEPWLAEDVHRALVGGNASLFRGEDGFLIVQRIPEAFSCRPFLNVWIAWFKPNKGKEMQQEIVAFLDKLVVATKSHTWKFNSPRRGWIALDGCEIERITYRRKQ